jgi:hypothetical protein
LRVIDQGYYLQVLEIFVYSADFALNSVGDRDRICALLLAYGKPNTGLAVNSGERAHVLKPVAHVGNIRNSYGNSVSHGYHGIVYVVYAFEFCKRAHRNFAVARGNRPRGNVSVFATKRRHNHIGRNAERVHICRA